MELEITDIYFVPMQETETNFIGFISFCYGGFGVKDISVYRTSTPHRYSLTYPEYDKHSKDGEFIRRTKFMHPIDKDTHQLVETAVNDYLQEHWDPVNKVLKNQKKIIKKGSSDESLSSNEVETAERGTGSEAKGSTS